MLVVVFVIVKLDMSPYASYLPILVVLVFVKFVSKKVNISSIFVDIVLCTR